ncbi:homeodomain-interacting protein kinase 1-like [Centropristis striata]|uniref:homeodomain-interacting protein kinase 1-like n=1 Tax=Centropristis striata TaxID=184440 RepID=UPI0027DF4CF8|nr:homeodomain-interacting protein kinase 1-like [Centropristis striata]
MATTPLIDSIENYKILEVLGQGCYGQVLHCLKLDTKENVAVKVLKKKNAPNLNLRELYMMETLNYLNPDKYNIVKCHEWFRKADQTIMVFEKLDISVWDYIKQLRGAPFPLNGIRTIIKDVATALKALKGIGLIHTDIKPDNIMLVNHKEQPFRAKLIDFGLTITSMEARPGLTVQPIYYRAPEVIMGFPFNEAIDVWSLGTLMAEILLGFPLFPGKHEYDVLRYITNVLGKLPNRLLKEGRKTPEYYHERQKYFIFQNWILKTPVEYFDATGIRPVERRKHRFSSLDDLKTFSQHEENSAEAADRSACVELLKKMLHLNPQKRITPSKILEHPFILGSYSSPSNHNVAEQFHAAVSKDTAEANTDDRSQAVQEEDHPNYYNGGDCVLVSISDSDVDNDLITEFFPCRSPSLDIDIKSIRLDVPNKSAEASDSINSPASSEDSEPQCKCVFCSNAAEQCQTDGDKDSAESNTDDRYEVPAGVIMVQPAKESMTTKLRSSIESQAVQDDSDSDCELVSIRDSEADSGLLTEFTTCRSSFSDKDIESIRLDVPNNSAPDSINSSASNEDSEPNKKKKGLRRLFSILKRKIFPCFCAPKVHNE